MTRCGIHLQDDAQCGLPIRTPGNGRATASRGVATLEEKAVASRYRDWSQRSRVVVIQPGPRRPRARAPPPEPRPWPGGRGRGDAGASRPRRLSDAVTCLVRVDTSAWCRLGRWTAAEASGQRCRTGWGDGHRGLRSPFEVRQRWSVRGHLRLRSPKARARTSHR